MSIKAEQLVDVICSKLNIVREGRSQFMTKTELLLVLAHIEMQEMHMASMKKEISDWRLRASAMTALEETILASKDGDNA